MNTWAKRGAAGALWILSMAVSVTWGYGHGLKTWSPYRDSGSEQVVETFEGRDACWWARQAKGLGEMLADAQAELSEVTEELETCHALHVEALEVGQIGIEACKAELQREGK